MQHQQQQAQAQAHLQEPQQQEHQHQQAQDRHHRLSRRCRRLIRRGRSSSYFISHMCIKHYSSTSPSSTQGNLPFNSSFLCRVRTLIKSRTYHVGGAAMISWTLFGL